MTNDNTAHSEVLGAMYPKTVKRLTFRQVDKVVVQYMTAANRKDRAQALARLLQSFHGYFLKYANLLKGQVENLSDRDTIKFLALFVPNPTVHPLYGASKGTPRQHEKSKRNYLNILSLLKRTCQGLSKEDIYNELCVLFIELLNSYEKRKGVSFTYYLTTYLKWGVQKWLAKLAKDPLNRNIVCYQNFEESYEEDFSDLQQLDLGWVIDPGPGIFSILSEYERFILYLRYKEGLGYLRISKHLARSPQTILIQLQAIYKKLKEQKDK